MSLNPFDDENKKPVEAPGQKYQRIAGEIAEAGILIGLNLTPRGRDALAEVIGELDAWWRVNPDHAETIKRIASFVLAFAGRMKTS